MWRFAVKADKSTVSEVIWPGWSSCMCFLAVHTHCWEPSLLFLPSLANRRFVEAAGNPGGLGGRERNSSEEFFISFIPFWFFRQYSCSIYTAADVSWIYRETSSHVPSGRSSWFKLLLHSRDVPSRTRDAKPFSCCLALRTPEQALQMFPALSQLLGLLLIGWSVQPLLSLSRWNMIRLKHI